jgi:hypothetical protein
MRIEDISTKLFTQTTITNFGVRFVYFDEQAFVNSGVATAFKSNFIITVNILNDGRVGIIATGQRMLSKDQVDEIQRVREIITSEKLKWTNECLGETWKENDTKELKEKNDNGKD